MGDLTTLAKMKKWLGITGRPITGITKANPGVVTCASHNLQGGQTLMISGVLGMTQVNGVEVTATVIDPNSFSIGVNTTSYGTYTSGGVACADDPVLAWLITGVSAWIEQWIGRNLASDDYTMIFSGKDQKILFLPHYPITAVSALSIDDVDIDPAVTSTDAGYVFDENAIYLRGCLFSRGVKNVYVTWTAGYSVGEGELLMAELACIDLVALKYRERDRIGQSSKQIGGETVSFIVKDLPDDVRTKLMNLKKVIPV